MKKRTRRILLLVLLAGLGYGFHYLWVRMPIINGYAAKNLCSCVFIADREQSQIESEELDYSFVKYASNQINTEQATVTSSFFGMRPKTAAFRPGFGCVLLDACDFNSSLTASAIVVPDALSESTSDKVQSAIENHFEEGSGARSVVVLKGNQIVGQKHTPGFDNKRQLGWSMTKSIMNALVGIAVQQGKINSLDDAVPLKFSGDKEITWSQLLQMNSGIEWTEDYGTISEATSMLYESCDMVGYTQALPFEAEPGTHWEYSSGTTNLISGALRKLYQPSEDYWNLPYRHLFAPCGMTTMQLETDGAGNYVGSSYSWATAEDWARFGLLYLNNGNANGEQIFPENWVAYTSQAAPGSNGIYGAQFWLQNDEEYPDVPGDMFFADGFQGQRIFIVPSEQLVIVRLGLTKQGDPDYNKLIAEVIAALV